MRVSAMFVFPKPQRALEQQILYLEFTTIQHPV